MVTGQVVVEKQVHPGHVIRHKVTPAGAGVELVAVISAVNAVLGEDDIFRGVVPGQQQIKGRAFEGEVLISAQCHPGSPPLAQPFLKGRLCRAGGITPGHVSRLVATDSAGEHTAGL